MTLITDNHELQALCTRLSSAEYLAVDTEFMRESCYWPRLCLLQIAGPGEAAAIDPLAEGIDLAPVFALMVNPNILKVFHSARQDIEIFVKLTGQVPDPIYDTQIAAMVCGFGESVGYEALIKKLVGVKINKMARFTDWSHRPLSKGQLSYALSDVIHLRPAYERLRRKIDRSGRASWLGQELADLTNLDAYRLAPEDAWKRLKPRSSDPAFLAILKEVAAWREREAQRRDLPRGRIVRDDALIEIAAHAPRSTKELARTRGLSTATAEGRLGAGILEAVAQGLACPPDQRPQAPPRRVLPPGIGPIVELLRVLLKMTCEEAHVAQKLVASTADLEEIAADDDADVPALRGWRREVFGAVALQLKHGKIGLTINGKQAQLISTEGPQTKVTPPEAAPPEATTLA